MRLVSLALPGVMLAATAAAASSQNYPSYPSFTYRAGGEPFGITFYGDRGWVAEDGGRIRYTPDYANTAFVNQAVVPSSVRVQLRGIHFPASKGGQIGFCVGDDGTVLKSIDYGVTWSVLVQLHEPPPPSSPPLATLHQVYFHDENEGWVMGDNQVLYHTTTGGALETEWTWVQPPGAHDGDVYDIAFPDPGDPDVFVIALDYGVLGRTTDGGQTFEQFVFDVGSACPLPDPNVPEPGNLEIWSVDFYDTLHGVAVGGVNTNNGYILRTADGGLTWTQENCMEFNCGSPTCVPVPTFYGAVATGAESALTVGYASIVMRRTTSFLNNGECFPCLSGTGGYGWKEASQASSTNPPGNWIALADLDTAFATGRNGRIRKITLGGTMIEDVGTDEWFRVEGAKFIDATTGFLVGQDRMIAKVSNLGQELELVDGPHVVPAGQANYLNAVDVDGLRVVAVGDAGKIRWSADGGTTWADGTGQRPVAFNNVHFGPNGFVYAVGNNSVLDVSQDGGATWGPSAFAPPVSVDLHDVRFTSSFWLLVGGNKFAAKSLDGGSSWASVTVTGAGTPTLRAITGAGNNLWVVGDGGNVYRYSVPTDQLQLQSLGAAATTVQLTDVCRLPGTNDVIVAGDQGVVLYYDADKILIPGQGSEYKWSAPKSYMGGKLVAVDMYSATSGMIAGIKSGVLQVDVIHVPF